MLKHKIPLSFAIMACLAIGVGLLLLPQPASAQCGSSASSCKNCHEVQGKGPVNTKGDWHTQHAFGDFCEFCHAGNVKAKDEEGAHTGLIGPLSDPKGSCQSCHASDYMARAQKYADTLGKPLGTGAPSGGNASTADGAITTSAASPVNCGPAPSAGGTVIDLNRVYAETNQPLASHVSSPGIAGAAVAVDHIGSSTPPGNVGNFVLIVLIAATLLVLLGLVWYYEKPLPRLVAFGRQILATPVVATTPEGVEFKVSPEIARRPEYSAVQRALANSDPATVRAVTQLLSDRENGPKLVKALSHMDLQTLTALGESDQKALAAMLALAKEINQ